jgi:hypothetical protein
MPNRSEITESEADTAVRERKQPAKRSMRGKPGFIHNTTGKLFSRKPSVLFISIHKCATTFFAREVMGRFTGRIPIDYQKLHYETNGIITVKTRKFGFVYGPIRILDQKHPSLEITRTLLREGNLGGRKLIFLVRDPRDIIVSMYYSFGFTHPLSPNEEIKAYQLERRRKIREKTIDEYALQIAPQVKEKFDIIRSLMQSVPAEDRILLTYEEMVEEFDDFYHRFSGFVELDPGVREKIFTHTRPMEKEQLTQHKRKGAPGDYKTKLKKVTIDTLNNILGSTLTEFGYRIP